jgi:hypothetical protein
LRIGKTRYETCIWGCCCCFTSLFGNTVQLGNLLAKNFEGEHRWITDPKYNPSARIDAMFFSVSGDKADDNDPT